MNPRPPHRKLIAAAFACLAMLGGPARAPAQPQPPDQEPSPQPDLTRPKLLAGRRELAPVYIRLEKLVMDRAGELSIETLRSVNRGMDDATDPFFLGNYSAAIERINQQIAALAPNESGAAAAFALRIDPVVVRPEAGATITVEAGPIYIPKDGLPDALDFTLVSAPWHSGKPPSSTFDGPAISFRGPRPTPKLVSFTLPEGSSGADIFLRARGGAKPPPFTPLNRIYATLESLDTTRAAILARLDKLLPAHPELAQAIHACRSRASALSDHRSDDNSYLFSADLAEFHRAVRSEAARLETGEDPYANTPGDFWLALRIGEQDVPCRLQFSPENGPAHGPLPLLIAIHGAGGDENLWMDGYGGGILKTLAAERGLLLISPRIVPGLFTPTMFDAIVDAVARWHNVDRSRIYVIGHSLGGGVATTWAKLRPDTIAAACSIAGVGSLSGSKRMAPMLAYGAELDTVIPASNIENSAFAAAVAGLPVEYRPVPNYGHVFVVGKVTREAVSWVLEHQLGARSPPTPPSKAAPEPAPAK